jgi:stage II sporulation protein D
VSVLLDLDGKILNFIDYLKIKMSGITVQRLFLWTVFLIGNLVFIIGGCGQRKMIPPPSATPKIPIIRVALDDNLSRGSLVFQDPFKLISEEATYILNAEMGKFSVSFAEGIFSLKSEQRSFTFTKFESIEIISAQGGTFLWNNYSYTGKLLFIKTPRGMDAINILPLPQYLTGVIPYEIPSHSEEYYQAIKAQTIAARTYAVYRMKNPESSDFDLFSDTRDQVYQGMQKNAVLVDKAIKETFGIILQTQQEKLVKIQYHSTCGGNIDPSTAQAETQTGEIYLQDQSETDANCLVSPLYRWMAKLTVRDILNNMTKLKLVNNSIAQLWQEQGFDMQLDVQSRKPSGRIDKLTIKIDDQSFNLQEWQIKRIFSDKPDIPQPSTLFILKSSPSEPNLVYVIGAGFGHGRGMCQWGAIGQSLNGKSYKDILNFYYPDLVPNKMY